MMEAIAIVSGGALHRTTLYVEAVTSRKRCDALLDMMTTLTSEVETAKVIERILLSACRILDNSTCRREDGLRRQVERERESIAYSVSARTRRVQDRVSGQDDVHICGVLRTCSCEGKLKAERCIGLTLVLLRPPPSSSVLLRPPPSHQVRSSSTWWTYRRTRWCD